MKSHKIALSAAFVIAGSLPWFTLGPASTLGVPGWMSGLAAVLAAALGASSAVLSALANKGMPARKGAAGPRLLAVAAALASMTSAIVWLSSSGNTQAVVGGETLLFHYGPGGPVTLLLAIVALVLTGRDLLTSKEPLPEEIQRVVEYVQTSRGQQNNTTSQGDRNRRATPGGPANAPQQPRSPVAAPDRKAGGGMAEDRKRLPPDVHLPTASGVPAPQESPAGPAAGGRKGVPGRPADGSDPEVAPGAGPQR